MDISQFYFVTPKSRPGYEQVKLSDILDKSINEYNFKDKETKDGSIHIVENCDMHGFP